MTFRVLEQHGLGNAQSPYRVIEDTGREVVWANRFLDQERVRIVSDATLRSYAHDLLHFVRWWVGVNQTDAVTEKTLTETTLLDYIRFQTNQHPRPAATSINHRVAVVELPCSVNFLNHSLPSPAVFSTATGDRRCWAADVRAQRWVERA